MPWMPRARMLLALFALLLVLPFDGAAAAQDAADSTAPGVSSAVGLSRTRVRIRFTEPITEKSIAPADVVLTMGGEPRRASRVEVAPDGTTAEVEAGPAWPYGTAGAIRVRGPLSDAAGHSSRADRPPVRVWAAPGDVTPPVLKDVRLTSRSVCIVGRSAGCTASGGTVSYTVDEATTIVLDLRRRSTDAPSLMKVLRGQGPGTVRFKEKIEGRRLRPGVFRLTVTAIDAAGNESTPVTLRLVVRH